MEEAIIVTDKVMKATKPQTTDSCWGELCPDVGPWIYDRADQIMAHMDLARKVGGEGYQETNFGVVQGLTDTTPEELTAEDLTEASASAPAVSEKPEQRPRAGKQPDA